MVKAIRKGNERDLDKLISFLESANVSQEGINVNTMDSFLLLESENGALEACIGIEQLGSSYGLLRSLVITSLLKQAEMLELFHQVELLAKEGGLETLCLVTNRVSTEELFQMLGFKSIDKEFAPYELRQSEHFLQSVEIENIILMKKDI